MELRPINGCVVVELTGELQHIEMPDKQYSTNTSGVVKAVDPEYLPDLNYLVGSKVYFEGFKDVEVPGEPKQAFVKIEDIRGYEQAQSEDQLR